MNTQELRQLLADVEDTRELVLRGEADDPARCEREELHAAWRAARAEANGAYDAWRRHPARDTYAIYRAAEDRADAAQDALTAAELTSAAWTNVTKAPSALNHDSKGVV
jgi:hypothetical protein